MRGEEDGGGEDEVEGGRTPCEHVGGLGARGGGVRDPVPVERDRPAGRIGDAALVARRLEVHVDPCNVLVA